VQPYLSNIHYLKRRSLTVIDNEGRFVLSLPMDCFEFLPENKNLLMNIASAYNESYFFNHSPEKMLLSREGVNPLRKELPTY